MQQRGTCDHLAAGVQGPAGGSGCPHGHSPDPLALPILGAGPWPETGLHMAPRTDTWLRTRFGLNVVRVAVTGLPSAETAPGHISLQASGLHLAVQPGQGKMWMWANSPWFCPSNSCFRMPPIKNLNSSCVSQGSPENQET